jgi:hypothetical protein
MLETELSGLRQQQLDVTCQLANVRQRGSPQREALFCLQRLLEINVLIKQIDLAMVTGDDAIARKLCGVLAEYLRDQEAQAGVTRTWVLQ